MRYENVYLEIVMQNNNANWREQLSNNREERSEYREIDAERTKTDEIYIYIYIYIWRRDRLGFW